MPKLLTTPFATSGSKNDVPTTTGSSANSATYDKGFPDITMTSFAYGGLPPSGKDFNGIFYDITDNIVYQTQGGRYKFDSAYATAIGGYPLGAILLLNDGVTDVISTIANNLTDPNVSMTGWVYKSQTLVTNDYTTLATLSAKDGDIAFVKKDGISGEFVYNSVSTATPNCGTIIASSKGGNWLRVYNGLINVKWFGAVGDGIADDTISIQKAISLGKPIKFGYNNNYKITSPILLKHGTDINGVKYSNHIDFNYSTIIPTFADFAIKMSPVGIPSDANTHVSQFNLENLTVDLSAFSGSKAFQFGNSTGFIDNFYQSIIKNILVISSDLTHGSVTSIENMRHVVFDRFVSRQCGVTIQCDTANMFTGDFVFNDCEFAGNSTSRPLLMQAGMTGTNGQVRGIRFINSTFYGSSTKIYADGNGQVGDIWLSACQFDAPPYSLSGDIALEIYAKGSGQLFQLHITDNYFVGYVGAASRLVTDESGSSQQISFNSCHFGNITGHVNSGNSVIYALSFDGLSVNNCEFNAITAEGVFNVDNSTRIKLEGNTVYNSSSTNYLALVGNASKNFMIVNNISNTNNVSIVNDYSTATSDQKLVVNNLKITQ